MFIYCLNPCININFIIIVIVVVIIIIIIIIDSISNI